MSTETRCRHGYTTQVVNSTALRSSAEPATLSNMAIALRRLHTTKRWLVDRPLNTVWYRHCFFATLHAIISGSSPSTWARRNTRYVATQRRDTRRESRRGSSPSPRPVASGRRRRRGRYTYPRPPYTRGAAVRTRRSRAAHPRSRTCEQMAQRLIKVSQVTDACSSVKACYMYVCMYTCIQARIINYFRVKRFD